MIRPEYNRTKYLQSNMEQTKSKTLLEGSRLEPTEGHLHSNINMNICMYFFHCQGTVGIILK